MIQLKDISNVTAEALQQLADNPRVAQNLRDVFPNPYTLDDARIFLQLVADNKVGHLFAIYHDDSFIGLGGIVPQHDVHRHSAEIGYWLGEPYWGKGYATKAVKQLTAHATQQLGFTRLFAGVFEGNLASMKVLEKAGYQSEGIARSSVIKHGRVMDQHMYGFVVTSDLTEQTKKRGIKEMRFVVVISILFLYVAAYLILKKIYNMILLREFNDVIYAYEHHELLNPIRTTKFAVCAVFGPAIVYLFLLIPTIFVWYQKRKVRSEIIIGFVVSLIVAILLHRFRIY